MDDLIDPHYLQNVSLPHFLESAKSVALDMMPSIRSLLATLGAAQAVLGAGMISPVSRYEGSLAASAVCSAPQLSCHNTSAVENLCCFNSPGGLLLQTQFWDTDPASGPSNSWTIHGLWPDNCDGTYAANCDDSRAYTNITAILNSFGDTTLLTYMKKYWTSNSDSEEKFWEHEWGKHGTCISTLDTNCYTDYKPQEEVSDFFKKTVSLFQGLPSYTWLSAAGITPSTTKTYTSAAIQAALSKNHGGQQVYLGCTNGELSEIWYYFNVKGSVQTGQFVPAAQSGSSTCPATGIKYLPKGTKSTPTSGTTGTSATGTATSTPTSTGPAFTGKGYLNVVTSGKKTGCIISKGTWYTSGTCATFTTTPLTSSSSSNGTSAFKLRSSVGPCGVVGGKLTCGMAGTTNGTFSASGSQLGYGGSNTFHADAVPSGATQGTVYSGASGHEVSLGIEWQGI